jgi:DNA mismatch repair ATPase MutS
MAGVPKEVINRAYSIMNDLEKDRVNYGEKEVDQLNLFNIKENKEH